MNFNWFRGILRKDDLTPDKHNKTWYQLEKFWNDHDSGISAFGNIAFGVSTSSKSSNYTAVPTDQLLLMDTTSSSLTLTLPGASGIIGKNFIVMNIGNHMLTISAASGQTINGNSTALIPNKYFHIELFSDGSNWVAI